MEKKRLKHTINYRDSEVDTEIYNWIEEKSKTSVLKTQDIIKEILHKEMLREKGAKK